MITLEGGIAIRIALSGANDAEHDTVASGVGLELGVSKSAPKRSLKVRRRQRSMRRDRKIWSIAFDVPVEEWATNINEGAF